MRNQTNDESGQRRRFVRFSVGCVLLMLLLVGVVFFVVYQLLAPAFISDTPPTLSSDAQFAVGLATSLASTKAASGGNSEAQQLFIDFGIKTAPLPNGTDPGKFDPLAAYSGVQSFVGDGSELISMTATYIRPDGTMDLNAQYSPGPDTEYKFIHKLKATPTNAPPVGAGGGSGVAWYEPVTVTVHHPGDATSIQSGINSVAYTNEGMESTTDNARNDSYKAIPEPTCAFTQLWKTAIAKGAPQDAVATIIYDHTGYEFAMYDIGFFVRFDTQCTLQSVEGPDASPTPEPR